MDQCLLKMLVFMTILNLFNTFLNVIHKLTLIEGPPAHVAMAILSMIVLFGYSGILNTLFLKRKFMIGRIVYLVIAISTQFTVLTLSILSWCQVITYQLAITIIHGLVGILTVINFACAVWVVEQQRQENVQQELADQKDRLQKQLAILQQLSHRKSNEFNIKDGNQNEFESKCNQQCEIMAQNNKKSPQQDQTFQTKRQIKFVQQLSRPQSH